MSRPMVVSSGARSWLGSQTGHRSVVGIPCHAPHARADRDDDGLRGDTSVVWQEAAEGEVSGLGVHDRDDHATRGGSGNSDTEFPWAKDDEDIRPVPAESRGNLGTQTTSSLASFPGPVRLHWGAGHVWEDRARGGRAAQASRRHETDDDDAAHLPRYGVAGECYATRAQATFSASAPCEATPAWPSRMPHSPRAVGSHTPRPTPGPRRAQLSHRHKQTYTR